MPKKEFDLEDIKSRYDCRELVERDLGKPAIRGQTYSSFKCPFHKEVKGASLVVYRNGWHCFGKCSRSGDVISWMQDYHGMSFEEACKRLDNRHLPSPMPVRPTYEERQSPDNNKRSEPPYPLWQEVGQRVVAQAEETLWSKEGARALAYLREERGLSDQVIRYARLGYVPGHPQEWVKIVGLDVPCGITIPWFLENNLWGIKVRRLAQDQRYQQIAGGLLKGCLYLSDKVEPGWPMIITEGEFDALVIHQVASDLVYPTSIGSAANKTINVRWYIYMTMMVRILVRTDADQAGDQAYKAIEALSQSVYRTQVPIGKDINEFFLAEGAQAVREWIQDGLRVD